MTAKRLAYLLFFLALSASASAMILVTRSLPATVTVLPGHDVAIVQLTVSRSFAYNGVNSNPIIVNVTAANQGNTQETFWVAALANRTVVIGNQTVTLASGQAMTISFSWNTYLLTRGIYQITAQAEILEADAAPANNSFAGPVFSVKFKGDVNGDCSVNIIDLATVGATFGETSGQAGFNPAADIDNNGIVNIVDLVVVGAVFGQHC